MTTNKIKSIYSRIAFGVFNTIVLFVAINIALALEHYFHRLFPPADSVSAKYGLEKLAIVYPGKSQQVVEDLLRETWSRPRPFVYEAFTQFKESPYRGNYVNVGENGFRFSKDQAKWPPDPTTLSIFVFGGSTTFGYGVSDAETIPSDLQEIFRQTLGRPVSIYNFGRALYDFTHERILFEQLLSAGHVPNLAIFIDGMNDFSTGPNNHLPFTLRIGSALVDRSLKATLADLVFQLPVGPLVLEPFGETEKKTKELRFDDSRIISNTIERYRSNKRMIEAISAVFSVKPVFVWQPMPTYKYDQKSHLFIGSGYGLFSYSIYGYPAMKAIVEKSPFEENFLWCADIQEGLSKPLYVDLVHYSAEFSQSIASCIAKLMVDRGLVDDVGNVSDN